LEYLRPKDAGPLFINLDRKIQEKKEPLGFRQFLMIYSAEKGWYKLKNYEKPSWLHPNQVFKKVGIFGVSRELQEIWIIKGSTSVPSNYNFDKIVFVQGDFDTGTDCSFSKYVFVKGNSKIGPANNLYGITVQGNLFLGEKSRVENFVDSDGKLRIGNKCEILGNITSNSVITIGFNCVLKMIHSDSRFIIGKKIVKKINGIPDKKTNWNLKRKKHRKIIQFNSKINNNNLTEYLDAQEVWVQENDTLRISGNIHVPKNTIIPYNLIVEGDLTSEADVRFQGSLKIKGKAIIGPYNVLNKSIVCQKELVLLDEVEVKNCIDSEDRIFIKNIKVGLGIFCGGIASGKTIFIEKVEGFQKIYSKDAICTVKTIEDIMPKKLKKNIEVIAL
jgi:predicted acyltransferase (DUF342 family)